MSRRIHIDNPLRGGKRSLGIMAALRYVDRGLAAWSGRKSIRFFATAPQNIAVARQVRTHFVPHTLASIEEIRNLPVVRDPELLLQGKYDPHLAMASEPPP